jgi:hypothetical protein
MDTIEQRLTTDVTAAQAVVDLGAVARYVALDGGRPVNLLRIGMVLDALGRYLLDSGALLYPVVGRELLSEAALTSKERMVLGRWADDGLVEVTPMVTDRPAEIADYTGVPLIVVGDYSGYVSRFPWLVDSPERVLRLSPRAGGAVLRPEGGQADETMVHGVAVGKAAAPFKFRFKVPLARTKAGRDRSAPDATAASESPATPQAVDTGPVDTVPVDTVAVDTVAVDTVAGGTVKRAEAAKRPAGPDASEGAAPDDQPRSVAPAQRSAETETAQTDRPQTEKAQTEKAQTDKAHDDEDTAASGNGVPDDAGTDEGAIDATTGTPLPGNGAATAKNALVTEVPGSAVEHVEEVQESTGEDAAATVQAALEAFALRGAVRVSSTRVVRRRFTRADPSGVGGALMAREWRCPAPECSAFGPYRRIGQPVPRMRAGVPACPRHAVPVKDVGPRPPAYAVCVVVDDLARRRFVVNGERPVTVGRKPDDPDGVSLQEWLHEAAAAWIAPDHLRLAVQDGQLVVTDDSENGTLVWKRSGPDDQGQTTRLYRQTYVLGDWDSVELYTGVELVRADRRLAAVIRGTEPLSVLLDAPTVAMLRPNFT